MRNIVPLIICQKKRHFWHTIHNQTFFCRRGRRKSKELKKRGQQKSSGSEALFLQIFVYSFHPFKIHVLYFFQWIFDSKGFSIERI